MSHWNSEAKSHMPNKEEEKERRKALDGWVDNRASPPATPSSRRPPHQQCIPIERVRARSLGVDLRPRALPWVTWEPIVSKSKAAISLLPPAQSVEANLSYSITPHKTLYILEVSDFYHSEAFLAQKQVLHPSLSMLYFKHGSPFHSHILVISITQLYCGGWYKIIFTSFY